MKSIGNNPVALWSIIAGGVVFIIALIIGVVIYMRKKRRASEVVYDTNYWESLSKEMKDTKDWIEANLKFRQPVWLSEHTRRQARSQRKQKSKSLRF